MKQRHNVYRPTTVEYVLDNQSLVTMVVPVNAAPTCLDCVMRLWGLCPVCGTMLDDLKICSSFQSVIDADSEI